MFIVQVRVLLDITGFAAILEVRIIEGISRMAPGGRLRAWIERQSGGGFRAAFLGVAVMPDGSSAVVRREPATRVCCSPEKARQWVEKEATAFGLPVEWVEPATASH